MYHPNGRDAGLRRVKAVTGAAAAVALVGTGVAGVTAFRHDQAVALAGSTVAVSGTSSSTSSSSSSAASSESSESSGLTAPTTPVTQAPTTSAPVAKSSGS